jgi:hypothetical protein
MRPTTTGDFDDMVMLAVRSLALRVLSSVVYSRFFAIMLASVLNPAGVFESSPGCKPGDTRPTPLPSPTLFFLRPVAGGRRGWVRLILFGRSPRVCTRGY